MKTYSDLLGDGGSNIVRQVVAQKREIDQNLAPLRRIMAIGSGKGGVGKSTLAMLLALAFRERGWKPAILDADINGPSQARLGGLHLCPPAPGKRGLVVPLTKGGIGVVSFGTLISETQAVDFPSVSDGSSFVWRATKEFSVLAQFLARTDWSAFDMLLIDLPPGAERTFQYAEFLGASARFVVVTLPSEVSRGVVRRSVAALARTTSSVLGYVENMTGYFCAACGEVRPLFPTPDEADLGLPCLGRIPFDPELAAACDRGLHAMADSRSPCLAAVRSICDNLLQAVEARE